LSDNVAIATNNWVVPRPMLEFAGVTVIEVMMAGVTVSVAADVMLENVAAMVVVPSLTAVANPVLLIVATPVDDEDHVATVVKSCSVKSAKAPVAVNCWVVPFAILALSGDTAMDARGDDWKIADPAFPSYAAVIVVVPALTALAMPFEPDKSLTPATPGSDEVQVAHVVKFC
jgi:hypothetical protein